jgi:hypothetical protein
VQQKWCGVQRGWRAGRHSCQAVHVSTRVCASAACTCAHVCITMVQAGTTYRWIPWCRQGPPTDGEDVAHIGAAAGLAGRACHVACCGGAKGDGARRVGARPALAAVLNTKQRLPSLTRLHVALGGTFNGTVVDGQPTVRAVQVAADGGVQGACSVQGESPDGTARWRGHQQYKRLGAAPAPGVP